MTQVGVNAPDELMLPQWDHSEITAYTSCIHRASHTSCCNKPMSKCGFTHEGWFLTHVAVWCGWYCRALFHVLMSGVIIWGLWVFLRILSVWLVDEGSEWKISQETWGTGLKVIRIISTLIPLVRTHVPHPTTVDKLCVRKKMKGRWGNT